MSWVHTSLIPWRLQVCQSHSLPCLPYSMLTHKQEVAKATSGTLIQSIALPHHIASKYCQGATQRPVMSTVEHKALQSGMQETDSE